MIGAVAGKSAVKVSNRICLYTVTALLSAAVFITVIVLQLADDEDDLIVDPACLSRLCRFPCKIVSRANPVSLLTRHLYALAVSR